MSPPTKKKRKLHPYEEWLTCHGLMNNVCIRETEKGLGVFATKNIKAEEILFRVPRRLCFGVGLGDPEVDSQKSVVKEVNRLTHDRFWSVRLGALSSCDAPFLWSLEARGLLKGTDLQAVVEAKVKRTEGEWKAGSTGSESVEEYKRQCAAVLSHANPWFSSTCLCPLNDLLNYSANDTNCEFAEGEDGESIVGTALADISVGDELFQSYCDSHNELIYRYGFAPAEIVCGVRAGIDITAHLLEEDVVSFTAADLGCGDSAVSTLILKKVGLLQESPWDGVDVFTLEVKSGGEEIWQLLAAIMIVVEGGGSEYEANDKNENEDNDEDKAAVLLISKMAAIDKVKLRESISPGSTEKDEDEDEEFDLWPPLLLTARKELMTPNVFDACAKIIAERMPAELPCSIESRESDMARVVVAVERTILGQLMMLVKDIRKDVLGSYFLRSSFLFPITYSSLFILPHARTHARTPFFSFSLL